MYLELFNKKHLLITLDTVELKLGIEFCPKILRFTINLIAISICIC